MAFEWTEAKEQAALAVALGELTKTKIAENANVTEPTLYNWLAKEEFAKRVDENRTAIRAEVFKCGIADVANRVKRRELRWRQIKAITEARAELLKGDPHAADAGSGIIVKTERVIGSGESARVIDVYEADVALLKEEREIEKQAAIELGQWQEKTQVDGTITVPGLEDALRRAYGSEPS